jgi:hypothetical protein
MSRQMVLSQSCLILALACSSPTLVPPNSGGGLITTESPSYTAVVSPTSVRLTVVAKFSNTTSDKLTLHPCYQHPPYPLAVSLQRYEDGEWHTVLSPVCTLALMLYPPRLSPGESRTDTVHLEGFRAANWYPKFPPGPVAGLYRLAYSDIYRTWNEDHNGPPVGTLGDPVPPPLLVSNPFRVDE